MEAVILRFLIKQSQSYSIKQIIRKKKILTCFNQMFFFSKFLKNSIYYVEKMLYRNQEQNLKCKQRL